MDANNRERTLIIAAILCITLLFGDRLILSPLIKSWHARSERIAELKQNLDKGQMLIDRQEALEARWQDMMNRSLTKSTSTAESGILNSVNRWAEESNLHVTSLKPRWLNGEMADKLEFRLAANGDAKSIARFLYELEVDTLAVSIEDLEITSRDLRGSELALSLRFTGITLKDTVQ